MVVVLTKTDWKALIKILTKFRAETQGHSDCAILVHPKAAAAYKKRTGRPITDWDSHIDYSFDAADYAMDLIGPADMKFAKKGSAEFTEEVPHCLGAILKSIGLGPDGVTEVSA